MKTLAELANLTYVSIERSDAHEPTSGPYRGMWKRDSQLTVPATRMLAVHKLPLACWSRLRAVLDTAWRAATPPLHVAISARCRPCESFHKRECRPQPATGAMHCLWQTFHVTGGATNMSTNASGAHARFRCPQRFRAGAQDARMACSSVKKVQVRG